MSPNPFSFHVPASHYRRRPAVRMSASLDGNPFALRLSRALVLACCIAAAFVAGQLVTLHAVGVL